MPHWYGLSDPSRSEPEGNAEAAPEAQEGRLVMKKKMIRKPDDGVTKLEVRDYSDEAKAREHFDTPKYYEWGKWEDDPAP